MKKFIILFVSLLCIQQANAINFIPKKSAEVVTTTSAVTTTQSAPIITENTITPEPNNKVSVKKSNKSFWYKCKQKIKALAGFDNDGGYDIFGLLSFIFLMASIAVAIFAIIAFVGALSGTASIATLTGTFLILLLIASLLSLGSFVTGIIGLTRYFKDPQSYKGKGFLFTSLGIWALSIISNIFNRQ